MTTAEAKLTALRTERDRIPHAQRALLALKQELAQAREELGRLTGGLKSDDDIALPVPQLSLGRGGLSTSGALLGFARTAERPFLLDSATGNVVLYFRGVSGQFFSAYYDTRVTRGSRRFEADGGQGLTYTVRDAGTDPAELRLRTKAYERESDRVRIYIQRGEESEDWRELPRRATDFAATLNGVPERPLKLGLVQRV